ncbi:hypothetical protein [Vibrio sp. WXL103]|uniref:hypothetical protein n=1 Tax=Vibrio sp. WXL103 TaxID=3450710 RepID=UPI003EC78FCB
MEKYRIVIPLLFFSVLCLPGCDDSSSDSGSPQVEYSLMPEDTYTSEDFVDKVTEYTEQGKGAEIAANSEVKVIASATKPLIIAEGAILRVSGTLTITDSAD